MEKETIKNQYEYYKNNIEELSKKYLGKHIVIKNMQVIGAYGSFGEALNNTLKDHEIGTFIIQHCKGSLTDEIQNFTSRVYVHAEQSAN